MFRFRNLPCQRQTVRKIGLQYGSAEICFMSSCECLRWKRSLDGFCFIYSITISASSGSLTDGKLSSNGTEINLCPFSMMRICSIDSLISVLAGQRHWLLQKSLRKAMMPSIFRISLLLLNWGVRWPTRNNTWYDHRVPQRIYERMRSILRSFQLVRCRSMHRPLVPWQWHQLPSQHKTVVKVAHHPEAK